ncbi:MAG TPA: hypothetical protein VFR86_11185 [Burkholderiaceae bacterium]|nr:hypothetical protein [Burkholderiaceae bacterium]
MKVNFDYSMCVVSRRDAATSPPDSSRASVSALRFRWMPSGRPSYAAQRCFFGPTGEDIEVRYEMAQEGAPHPSQIVYFDWLRSDYLFVLAIMLPDLEKAYRQYVGAPLRRLLFDEFVLNSVFIPADVAAGGRVELTCRSRSDRRYSFVVSLSDLTPILVRVDADAA